MGTIRVTGVANFGGFVSCVVDGKNIAVDKNIAQEGIDQVSKIVRYSQTKQDVSLADTREEYICAGTVR